MTKYTIAIPVLLIAAIVTSNVGNAQTFKVQKYNIGGDGGTDYLTAEPGTGRVFVSRGTHTMVVDGTTGKVIGDILTLRVCTASHSRQNRITASLRTAAIRL